MSKKYRLLKDLPDAKAGTELVFDGMEAYDYISEGMEGNLPNPSWYKREFVENNLEWFEEIKEPSHTQQEPERVQVAFLRRHVNGRFSHYEFSILNDGNIPEGKFPSIKEAIEKVLNEQSDSRYDGLESSMVKLDEIGQWQEPKRDWEIVAYLYKGTVWQKVAHSQNGDYRWGNGLDRMVELQMQSIDSKVIHSVRRLSDGEVFTVGDEVEYKKGGTNSNWEEYWNGKIISMSDKTADISQVLFKIDNVDEGFVAGKYIFNVRKKLPPKPQVLFTTEDGKKVFENDDIIIYHVSPNYDLSFSGSRYLAKQNRHGFKFFLSKEKAAEYILMNKPCLSVNDILALWPLSPEPKNAITDLAKFKQKQPTT